MDPGLYSASSQPHTASRLERNYFRFTLTSISIKPELSYKSTSLIPKYSFPLSPTWCRYSFPTKKGRLSSIRPINAACETPAITVQGHRGSPPDPIASKVSPGHGDQTPETQIFEPGSHKPFHLNPPLVISDIISKKRLSPC